LVESSPPYPTASHMTNIAITVIHPTISKLLKLGIFKALGKMQAAQLQFAQFTGLTTRKQLVAPAAQPAASVMRAGEFNNKYLVRCLLNWAIG